MAKGMPRDRYTIDSLYFDTRDFQLYFANEMEMAERFKARIRNYPSAPGGPVFLEIKARDGDIILKTRGPVKREQWRALVENPPVQAPSPAAERFLALKMRHGLRPVLAVRYEREPWVSTIDPYTRVTFDMHIRHQRVENLSLDYEDRLWASNDDAISANVDGPRSPVIVELKFERAVPQWLSRLVAKLNLERRSFSKYGTAIVRAYEPRELRTSPLAGKGGR